MTSVIVRQVRPGRQADYEAWLAGIIAEAKTFEGHEGVTIIRPRPGGPLEYTLVVRFRDLETSRNWINSEARASWFERLEPLVASTDLQEQCGLETWFTLSGSAPPPPPPRHKMAVVTWLAIYPLLVLTNTALGPVLAPLPLAGRILVVTFLLIPLMTWVVMPRMTWWFWGWLYPGTPRPVG